MKIKRLSSKTVHQQGPGSKLEFQPHLCLEPPGRRLTEEMRNQGSLLAFLTREIRTFPVFCFFFFPKVPLHELPSQFLLSVLTS